MMRTKQLLSFCNIAAGIILLLPFSLSAKGGKQDSSATATPVKRLVLSPQARLQLITEPIWGDSVEAIVTIAVPDSCKNQRYLCRFETSAAMRFVTVPRYKWAVREDSLKVLSALPLQIRLPQQSFIASVPVVKIHFKNLDHAAGLTGTATLEILSGPKSIPAMPMTTASGVAAISVAADSAQRLQPLPATTGIDSVATASGSSAFGIFYVALGILLISLFAGLGWLMTWSQRRRFQSIAAKTTAVAFPHLQQLEPAPAQNGNPAVNEAATGKHGTAETPEVTSPPSNLPAVIAPENQLEVALVLSQLHELKIILQQIMANQHEANQRLAQITAAAALEAPRASTQLALFDILNDEAPARNGESYTDGNGASHLPLQPPADRHTGRRPAEKDGNTTASPNPGSTSNLRIFFANTVGHNETSDEVLLH
jgi:hypothetical protein